MDNREEFESLIQLLSIEAIEELIYQANMFLQSSIVDFYPHD